MIRGLSEFVPAARRASTDGRQVSLAGVGAGIFDRQTGFVCEFAEVDLVAVCGLAEHSDVGTGAEDIVLGGTEDDDTYLGMLEPQALNGIRQLDVHAQVIRVQLQLITTE